MSNHHPNKSCIVAISTKGSAITLTNVALSIGFLASHIDIIPPDLSDTCFHDLSDKSIPSNQSTILADVYDDGNEEAVLDLARQRLIERAAMAPDLNAKKKLLDIGRQVEVLSGCREGTEQRMVLCVTIEAKAPTKKKAEQLAYQKILKHFEYR
jgi:hypothetical protein